LKQNYYFKSSGDKLSIVLKDVNYFIFIMSYNKRLVKLKIDSLTRHILLGKNELKQY